MGLIGTQVAVATTNAPNLYPSPLLKRRKLTPPPLERVMIYVRQENELAFTPLHLVPPTSLGLLDAVRKVETNLLFPLIYFNQICVTYSNSGRPNNQLNFLFFSFYIPIIDRK